MKKTLYWLFASLILLSVGACSDDEVNVYPEPDERPHEPFVVSFYIVDKGGKDLIREGWVRTSDVYAVYRGQKYPCNEDFNTRFNEKVTLHGLAISSTKGDNGKYQLTFGQLDTATDYKDETITLHWSDGSTDKYTFSRAMTWNRFSGIYDTTQSCNFNGQKNPAECNLLKPYVAERETPDGYMVPMEWIVNDEPLQSNAVEVGPVGGTYLLECANYPTFSSITLSPQVDWVTVKQINNKLVLDIEPYTDATVNQRSTLLKATYRDFEGNLLIVQKNK